MKKLIGTLILLGVVNSAYAANPASKEYVDQQDQKLLNQIDLINAQNANSGKKFRIGQHAQGGVIFYLEPGNQHGLSVALNDSGHLKWNTGSDTQVSAYLSGVYLGKQNQEAILSVLGTNAAAAQACVSPGGGGGFSDWYLPSITELNLVFLNKSLVGNFDTTPGLAHYWSSSVDANTGIDAFNIDFNDGDLTSDSETATTYFVRCIRSF